MTSEGKQNYSGSRIDFREMILSIWRAKWFVIIVTFVAALFALFISITCLPKKYQASVVISITEREQWVQVYQKNLTRIAKSDELIDLTFLETAIADPEQRSSTIFAVSLEYWGLMQLHVIAEDPVWAAEAANTWAELVYERMEEVYGVSEDSLNVLQDEVDAAEVGWTAAREALNHFSHTHPTETYTAQLKAAQSALTEALLEEERNQLLISDALTIKIQIEGLGSVDHLNAGTALSLFNLLARATIEEEGSGMQIQADQIYDLELSTAEAINILDQFIFAVENQNNELSGKRIALEEEISDWQSVLDNTQDQIEQLTVDRDLAKSKYIKLSNQLDDFISEQGNIDSAVEISTRAIPPTKPISPDHGAIAMFAGMAAALISLLVVIFLEWWDF